MSQNHGGRPRLSSGPAVPDGNRPADEGGADGAERNPDETTPVADVGEASPSRESLPTRGGRGLNGKRRVVIERECHGCYRERRGGD